jgi:hypothetical protein
MKENTQPELVSIFYKTPNGVIGEWKVSVQVAGGKDEKAKRDCLKYWHPNYEYLTSMDEPKLEPKGRLAL